MSAVGLGCESERNCKHPPGEAETGPVSRWSRPTVRPCDQGRSPLQFDRDDQLLEICQSKVRVKVSAKVEIRVRVTLEAEITVGVRVKHSSMEAGRHRRLTRGFLKNSYLAKFFLKYSRLSVSIPQAESTSRTDSWSSIVLSGDTRKKD